MRDPRENPMAGDVTTDIAGGHFIVISVHNQQVVFSGPHGEEVTPLDVWQMGAKNDTKPRVSLAAIL